VGSLTFLAFSNHGDYRDLNIVDDYELTQLTGVLPHDGRNFTFKEMGDAVHKYYNCSPSFSYFICKYIAGVLKRKYSDKLDLGDLCVHNGIVSLTAVFTVLRY